MADVPDLIELAGGPDAGAVRLAEVVSLAVRVDRAFLRKARRRFLPDLGPDAEADLWLGPLVSSRGPDGFVLRAAATEWLRGRLARDQERLREVGELLLDEHAFLPPALRLEERVTYWGLSLDKSDDDIQKELARVLKALHDPRRGALNIWVDRAFGRLPARVRALPAASRLLLAAAAWNVSSGKGIGENGPNASLADWMNAVPFKSDRRWPFEVTLRGSTVELAALDRDFGDSLPGAERRAVLRVPDTEPLVVEVSWKAADRRRARLVELRPGAGVTVTAGDQIEIFLADGLGYRIEPRQERRTCFVIQALGKKTDYYTGRVFDMDASYAVIRQAVEEAGLECQRVDEMAAISRIDLPPYRQIFEADLVIVDLSLIDFSVAYALGVCHGLRPRGTLVVASSENVPMLDISFLFFIFSYGSPGESLSKRDAEAFRQGLVARISAMMELEKSDSPVYHLLPELQPPQRPSAAEKRDRASDDAGAVDVNWSQAPPPETQSDLVKQADEAMERGDYTAARALYETVLRSQPNEPYIVRRLSRSIYMSESPTPLAALETASDRLAVLSPEDVNDPPTLAAWGEVHLRLWKLSKKPEHLDRAIRALEKGFYLRGGYFDGLQLAFLFNARAHRSQIERQIGEAITDFVLAQRARRRVIEICERLLETREPDAEHAYWYQATLAEAWLGLGERKRSQDWLRKAFDQAEPSWKDVTQKRLDRLAEYLEASPLPAVGP